MTDRVRSQIEQNNNEKLDHQNYQTNSKNKKRIQLVQQVLFDEKLSQAFYLLLNCLYQKSIFLDALNQDTINLDNLEKLSNKLLIDRLEVKNALKQLIIENGSQAYLQKMCKLYDLILDIDNYFERKISQQNQFNCLTSIPLSSKESCSVYISFTTKLGVVTKISNNFEKVVPVYSNKEVIGKNINFMQPDVVAPVHNKILTKFIQKKIVSQKVDDYPLLIGKDKRGFGIPYHIKIQVAMIGLEDFGCAGWIKQIKDSNHYIMTSADQGFKNYILGQSFFELILSFSFKQSELSAVRFGHLIPLFQTLFDNNMSGKSFQTILIRPLYKEQIANSIKVKNNASLFQELIDLDLYKIQAQFIYLSTTFATFNYLIITQCDYLDNLSSKRDALKEFRKDLKIYHQSEEYDMIDFEQLNPSFQNEPIQQKEDELRFLNSYNDQSIDSQNDDIQKQNSDLIEPQNFQANHNIKYATRLQKIIKQNMFKINQMYKNLKDDQKSILQEQNIQQRNKQSLNHDQYNKFDEIQENIDEIQENIDTNLSPISRRSSSQKQSFNTLITSRVEKYFDEAKIDDQINNQNSSSSHAVAQGIEQMLFEDQKQKKDTNQVQKQNSSKYIDIAKQQLLAQYQKNKEMAKTSNLNQTKLGRDQDTNVSADISFILNQRKKQTTAQGSVNLSNQKSTSQNRLQLVKKIKSNGKKHLLFYSGYILDSLLIILLVVSVSISFSSNYNFIEDYQTKQDLFSDLNAVKKLIYNILEEVHLIDGVQKNYFTLQSSVDQQSFLQTLNLAKDSNIYQYKNISQSIFQKYINQQRAQDLYNEELNYSILSYVGNKFISQEISKCDLYISLLRIQSLLTMFINNTSPENFIFQNELRHNQNQTQTQISSILLELDQNQNQNYKAQQNNIFIFIIIYGCFIFFYSILLLIFYTNSNSLKHSLLSIFATIDIKKLDEMKNKTTQIIKYLMDSKKKHRILDKVSQNKESNKQNLANKQEYKKNCKKKNISLTTYEKKLTASKVFLIVFCLSIVLIKPCIEFYLINIELDFMKISGSLQSKLIIKFIIQRYLFIYFFLVQILIKQKFYQQIVQKNQQQLFPILVKLNLSTFTILQALMKLHTIILNNLSNNTLYNHMQACKSLFQILWTHFRHFKIQTQYSYSSIILHKQYKKIFAMLCKNIHFLYNNLTLLISNSAQISTKKLKIVVFIYLHKNLILFSMVLFSILAQILHLQKSLIILILFCNKIMFQINFMNQEFWIKFLKSQITFQVANSKAFLIQQKQQQQFQMLFKSFQSQTSLILSKSSYLINSQMITKNLCSIQHQWIMKYCKKTLILCLILKNLNEEVSIYLSIFFKFANNYCLFDLNYYSIKKTKQ
ncbi:transmembrane protein, putative (macronuclear) [Tetrahymena thermophila SB210]|uniref:Transmembrane protein, putative n=1 Tax=Tetrahymena thermophila (strain SB210) TaxID=312017 RepID=Q23QB9_TETTS|nr:transmembrane protein, putative [Tetrahymena thermophila SB210]EAR98665.2 transmembrane protein, putative [Tetrahymena thermophila SB210]|eukprot:XP_001018910.2 transmembrane protein, putative [Tetrahymena thermophila SB210]